ncbi:MAG: ATP-dependent DNA helicase RecG [Gammaproteobacteria bacterium]|nr:ATP-dependent DNA helicase RecG [Gammaproteobacteria bacterium]
MNKSSKLSLSIDRLPGVGDKLKQKLQRLGIEKVQDLLFLLPNRYIDRTHLTPIGALRPGQTALAQGNIELSQVKFGKRRSLLCRLSDGTGALQLRFFYFSKQQQAKLTRDALVRCWGTARRSGGILEMVHPEYQHIVPEQADVVEQTLTPVYPATEGLTQARLRRLTDQAVRSLANEAQRPLELLPEEIRRDFTLPDLLTALRYVHRPPPDADTEALLAGNHPAQQRLAFEELLAHHLSLLSFRRKIHRHSAAPLTLTAQRKRDFIRQLPFELTPAQTRVLKDLERDLAGHTPMLRLVQGDVGSGKTVLAALAALHAIDSGYQAAIMAPTELLAEQHYQNFSNWFSKLGVAVTLLTGKIKAADRKNRLRDFAGSTPVIAIGTHALFQEQVVFGRLGLIIVDEQHRFGVHQRLALLEKGAALATFPHQLIMTATPIPRTITMTVFADLDISVIDALPPGRLPVNTVVLANDKRPELIARIAEVCRQGRQVYWICTLIEESDAIQSQAATDTYDNLRTLLPDLRIGLIHGKMKSLEKDRVMTAYKAATIDLLVATTVIEVGVDVPAASLMVIENAERLGLSQLHQLRGRIGRGQERSDCILLYQPPLSDLAMTRLAIMRSTTDGFEIANKDMELRGPGEILGTRQSGLPELRVADLLRDAGLIPAVQRAARLIQEQYPDRVEALISRWLTDRQRYGNV